MFASLAEPSHDFTAYPAGTLLAHGLSARLTCLSEGELDVFRLMAQRLSIKEIGVRLHIEAQPIKWRSDNVFGRLGVKNRGNAIAKLRELGVVTPNALSLQDGLNGFQLGSTLPRPYFGMVSTIPS